MTASEPTEKKVIGLPPQLFLSVVALSVLAASTAATTMPRRDR
jgi:hypothetical protein